MNIDVKDAVKSIIDINDIEPFLENWTFYYDESGNCRKFLLTENGVNAEDAINGDFVLAGVAHEGEDFQVDVEKLKQMNISPEVVEAFEWLKFQELTSIQEKCIPYMMDGNDIIAIAPTGTGKTLGFGIPMLEYINLKDPNPQELVLAPTRELAQQIADDLSDLAHFIKGVRIAVIYGGQPFRKQLSAL